MRPKIPILLYCADEDLLTVITYGLRLHHYDVAAVRSVRDAINTVQAFHTSMEAEGTSCAEDCAEHTFRSRAPCTAHLSHCYSQ